jgi:AcrR family transcriptional regulator
MDSKLPLRARKKAKVREALISASFRLFSKKGYTETTLEEICGECEVTVQTLLRYFGSKDDLLFANHSKIFEKFNSGLMNAAKQGACVEYWMKFLHSQTVDLISSSEGRQTYKIIVGTPSLLARFYAIARQYQTSLEQALSQELGVEAGEDMHSRLLAHLIVMGPIEEALWAISQGHLDSIDRRCDSVARYVLANFKRPEKAKRVGAPSRKNGKRLRGEARLR